MPESDRHHILYYRNDWESRPDSKILRRTQFLIPTLDREVHEELHRNVELVPTLGRHAINQIRREFRPVDGNYFKSIDALLFEIDRSRDLLKYDNLEREVADLAIHSIELQLPFIRDGIVNPRNRTLLYSK